MCLPVAVARPNDVLATGSHLGFEWSIVHNTMGYRCGYVKVERGHPWFGKGYDDIEAEVHGGLTFAEADKPCDKGGPDDGWWVGFDCAHGGDAPDPQLNQRGRRDEVGSLCRLMSDMFHGYGEAGGPIVRTQEYVEAECRSLCEQAAKAGGASALDASCPTEPGGNAKE